MVPAIALPWQDSARGAHTANTPRIKHVKHGTAVAHLTTVSHRPPFLVAQFVERLLCPIAFAFLSAYINMDDIDFSDSDTDAFPDTPAVRKNRKNAPDGAVNPEEGTGAGKTRTKESHYSAEEAREAALRKELESVRNVNKVIEGVVDSLQKAKNNMDVGTRVPLPQSMLLIGI